MNEIDAYNRLNILTKRYYLIFLFNIIQNESMKFFFSKMKTYDLIYKMTKKNIQKLQKLKKKNLKS